MISQELADQLLAEVREARKEINAATRRLGNVHPFFDVPSSAVDRELRAMDAAPELEPSPGETFDSYHNKVEAWKVKNPEGELPTATRMSLALLAFESLFGFSLPYSDAMVIPCESGEHAMPSVIVSAVDLETLLNKVVDLGEFSDEEILDQVRTAQPSENL